MKKFTLIALLGGVILGHGSAFADVQAPYSVDFNSSISTSSHDFKVAPGWSHVAETSAYGSYVQYTYSNTEGVDGSGALKIGTNVFSDGYGDHETITDLLITPKLTGTVSLQVQKQSRSGSITFYYVNYDNGTYTKGDKVDVTLPDLYTDEFSEVTISGLDGKRIGIAGNNVIIDNFTAESADVELAKTLAISKVDGSANSRNIDVTADGTFPLSFDVTLKNNGDVDIAADDENNTLSVINYADRAVLSTVPVGKALAVGDEATVTVTANVDAAKYPNNSRYDIKENISGTTSMGSWVTPVPYAPVFSLTDANDNVYADTSATTKPIAFGLITADKQKALVIKNSGAAPLNITGISTTEGFTTDATLPLTVAAHGSQALNLTMQASAPGAKTGTLTISAENGFERTVDITGQVLDPDAWYVNFEDNKLPVNMYSEGSWEVGDISGNKLDNNKYAAQMTSTVAPSKLVSPKLRVNDGDALTFAAARYYAENDFSQYINVYYSADRHNWTKVRTLSADADNDADKLTEEYTGYSWGKNTSYNFQTYTINNIPAGEWYVAFEAGCARIDDILGYKVLPVDHDIVVESVDAPANAIVNNDITVTVKAKNLTDNTEAADSYTAKLYIDGEEVATAVAPEFAAGGENTYTFTFAPHKSGNVKLAVAIVGNAFTSTDTLNLTIANEVASREVQILTSTGISANAPVYGYNTYTDSETNYSAEQLGLASGTKITSIIYKGYNAAAQPVDIKVYLQNNDDDVKYTSPYSISDGSDMEKVFDGRLTIDGTAGSESKAVPMLTINFAEPFVYTGGNLKIVTISKNVSGYKRCHYEEDGNVDNQTLYRSADSNISGSPISAVSSPVVHFLVETQPATVAGKVTDADGNAVVGATVSLTNGNILYGSNTDADGNYSFSVVQNDKSYNLVVSAAGYAPYSKSSFTAAKDTTVNVVLNVANGFFVQSQDIPATATVNHPYKATVSALNTLTTELKADDYTATLYVDGEAVATAETVDAQAGATVNLSFTYYPHVAKADVKAYILIKNGDNEASGDTVSVNIKNEQAVKEVVVGTPGEVSQPSYSTKVGPISSYDKISENEIVYTKDLLKLDAGTVITGITFKGYHSRTITAPVRVYIENTDEDLTGGAFTALHDTTTMTKVLDKTITFTAGGDSKNFINELTVDLGDGFTYTGTNLRVVTAFGPSDSWGSIYFESDKSVNDCSYSRSDDNSVASESFSATALPVAHLTVVASKKLTGVITDEKTSAPIAGATVTLKSGDVEYYATSDDAGNYTVDVTQSSLDYNAIFTAEGYKSDTISVSFADGDITKDVALKEQVSTGITDVKAATSAAKGNVYTVSGVLVRKAGERLQGLKPGVYIVDGKKVILK